MCCEQEIPTRLDYNFANAATYTLDGGFAALVLGPESELNALRVRRGPDPEWQTVSVGQPLLLPMAGTATLAPECGSVIELARPTDVASVVGSVYVYRERAPSVWAPRRAPWTSAASGTTAAGYVTAVAVPMFGRVRATVHVGSATQSTAVRIYGWSKARQGRSMAGISTLVPSSLTTGTSLQAYTVAAGSSDARTVSADGLSWMLVQVANGSGAASYTVQVEAHDA